MMRLIIFSLAIISVAGFTPSVEHATRTSVQSSVKVPFARSTSAQVTALSASVAGRLYDPSQKETPKVLGGVKIGLRELVVITGASSGLGLATAKQFMKNSDKYFLIMACRDVEKGKRGTLLNYISIRRITRDTGGFYFRR